MLFAQVAKILAEIIDIEDEEITPEMGLTNEHGIKAIDLARLVIECEKKFKITIYDEDVHAFKCVNDIAEYIERVQADW